jgi:hypothetical protein
VAGQYVRQASPDGTVVCGTDASGSGTVTSITTGAGLTGGPITFSGTIAIAPGGIRATQIDGAQVQARVASTCPSGQSIRAVNADRTVTLRGGFALNCTNSAVFTYLMAQGASTFFDNPSCPVGCTQVPPLPLRGCA